MAVGLGQQDLPLAGADIDRGQRSDQVQAARRATADGCGGKVQNPAAARPLDRIDRAALLKQRAWQGPVTQGIVVIDHAQLIRVAVGGPAPVGGEKRILEALA